MISRLAATLYFSFLASEPELKTVFVFFVAGILVEGLFAVENFLDGDLKGAKRFGCMTKLFKNAEISTVGRRLNDCWSTDERRMLFVNISGRWQGGARNSLRM